MSATPGKITSVRYSSDGENWYDLNPAGVSVADVPVEQVDDAVELKDWMSLLGPVQFHMTFDVTSDCRRRLFGRGKGYKKRHGRERANFFKTDKHNLKRPKEAK